MFRERVDVALVLVPDARRAFVGVACVHRDA